MSIMAKAATPNIVSRSQSYGRPSSFMPGSRGVTNDGIRMRVEIFKLAGSDDGLSLEVTDHECGNTDWEPIKRRMLF